MHLVKRIVLYLNKQNVDKVGITVCKSVLATRCFTLNLYLIII